MSWLSLAIALLKLANAIFTWYQQNALIAEGYDKAIADEALKTLKLTSAGKKIMERVDAMDEKTVDAELHGLEPPAG